MKSLTKPLVVLAAVAGVASLAAGPAAADEAAQEQVAANFVEADADGDSALTFEEFKTLIDLNAEHGIGRAKMVQRFGKYDTAFGRVDTNADGLLSTDELAAMAERAAR